MQKSGGRPAVFWRFNLEPQPMGPFDIGTYLILVPIVGGFGCIHMECFEGYSSRMRSEGFPLLSEVLCLRGLFSRYPPEFPPLSVFISKSGRLNWKPPVSCNS